MLIIGQLFIWFKAGATRFNGISDPRIRPRSKKSILLAICYDRILNFTERKIFGDPIPLNLIAPALGPVHVFFGMESEKLKVQSSPEGLHSNLKNF